MPVSCATASSRQRVTAALGEGLSVLGRSIRTVPPVSSAASCSRRLAVRDIFVISPITAATRPQRSPSSIAQSASASRRGRTRIISPGSMPNCSRAGPYNAPASSAQGRSHQRIAWFSVCFARRPASRAQNAVAMPASDANTSCSAPFANPPAGR